MDLEETQNVNLKFYIGFVETIQNERIRRTEEESASAGAPAKVSLCKDKDQYIR